MIIKKITKIILMIALPFFNFWLVGCGSLEGGIGNGVYFPASKMALEGAIDSLYTEHPEYKIPDNWKPYDNWSARGYDFIESRIFYFKSPPEEMYYVTFIGDSAALVNTTRIGIGISAIDKGSDRWLLSNDLNTSEKKRIIRRFNDEIIVKLKQYLKIKRHK